MECCCLCFTCTSRPAVSNVPFNKENEQGENAEICRPSYAFKIQTTCLLWFNILWVASETFEPVTLQYPLFWHFKFIVVHINALTHISNSDYFPSSHGRVSLLPVLAYPIPLWANSSRQQPFSRAYNLWIQTQSTINSSSWRQMHHLYFIWSMSLPKSPWPILI